MTPAAPRRRVTIGTCGECAYHKAYPNASDIAGVMLFHGIDDTFCTGKPARLIGYTTVRVPSDFGCIHFSEPTPKEPT